MLAKSIIIVRSFLIAALASVSLMGQGWVLFHGMDRGTQRPRVAETPFLAMVREVADVHDLHPALLMAVMHAESHFDPKARSHQGAMGLMQINATTARHLDLEDVWNPSENTRGGACYLRELIIRFGGDLRLVLAAYNAGPSAVRKYNAIPPYRETRAYVRKVLHLLQGYQNILVASAQP
ncbi:MAG: lytic transglycosylase domain-containing protein [Deltaproteobacteria bacterium]|nr:lytic transglycosylase domain-containing protein [Deltaproteobacteria bacterium]